MKVQGIGNHELLSACFVEAHVMFTKLVELVQRQVGQVPKLIADLGMADVVRLFFFEPCAAPSGVDKKM